MSDSLKPLRQTIVAMFRKLSMDPHHSPLVKQKDRELAGRFIDRIHTNSFDTASLPYYSKNGLAKGSNKAECVLALMCDVVLTYWRIAVAGAEDLTINFIDELNSKLKRLQNVYDNYDQLKILGDIKGYCLFESQRKDLYGKKESKSASEEVSPEKIDEWIDGTTDGEETQVGTERVAPDLDDGYGTTGGGLAPLE